MSVDFAAQRDHGRQPGAAVSDVTDLNHPGRHARRAARGVLPAGQAYLAYADAEVEYAPGRWLLRPRDVAKLLQALAPRPASAALAIAAPYAAAVLQPMGLSVARATRPT